MVNLLLAVAVIAFVVSIGFLLDWLRHGATVGKLEKAVWDADWDASPMRFGNVTQGSQVKRQLEDAHAAAVEACQRVRRRRKFSRRAAMACVGVGLLFLGSIPACGSYLAGQGGAPAAARAWVDRNRPSWYVSECQPRDTNRDGYVTCTIVGPGEAIDAIECGVDRWFHGFGVSGCKPALRGIR